MSKTKKRRVQVAIIGKGRVGMTLAKALKQRGNTFELFAHLRARDPLKTLSKLGEHGGPEIIIFAVRDQLIRSVSRNVLSVTGRNLRILAHCAGAYGPTELSGRNRAARATLHPMQTFATIDPPLLDGITFAISTTDKSALSTLRAFVREIGANQILEIKPDQLALYHAMVVYSANFIVLLGTLIELLSKELGLKETEVKKALRPIMFRSLENVLGNNSKKVLTGPIARGDKRTINLHRRALQSHPPIVWKLYNDLIGLAKKFNLYGGAK